MRPCFNTLGLVCLVTIFSKNFKTKSKYPKFISYHRSSVKFFKFLFINLKMTVLTGPSFAAYGSGGGWSRGSGNQTVVDKVLPEMLHLVDAHWYQFPPMNPLWHAILGLVIGCLGLVSIIGNGMVVFIFTSTKNLRTPSNLLVVNLAFADFLMMFCMAPPMVCLHHPPARHLRIIINKLN